MSHIGIIVNPTSGKDIRRVIANGTVVTNQEKINIVVRMIMAMDALGVARISILPDPTHIGQRVIENVTPDLRSSRVDILDLPYTLGTYKDSLAGTRAMRDRGFDCIVVLGGDGTSRVVASESGPVPILPVSTGTNNVFPRMVEGTLAGMGAAKIALGHVDRGAGCTRAPRLELLDEEGSLVDTALVDLAVIDARDLGSRAVWEGESLRELFLATASPGNIGLSSIGGWLSPLDEAAGPERKALHVEMAPDGEFRVTAPIAPGMMREIRVSRYHAFGLGEMLPLTTTGGVIALDGEREVLLGSGRRYTVRFSELGPWVIDLDKTLSLAAKRREETASRAGR